MKFTIINEDGTFSGAFINATITFIYLALIIVGVFYSPVTERLIKLKDIMMWFFTASFGIWTAKKAVDTVMGDKSLNISTEDKKNDSII